jgi:hypothetical protein
MDTQWTREIVADFMEWLEENGIERDLGWEWGFEEEEEGEGDEEETLLG